VSRDGFGRCKEKLTEAHQVAVPWGLSRSPNAPPSTAEIQSAGTKPAGIQAENLRAEAVRQRSAGRSAQVLKGLAPAELPALSPGGNQGLGGQRWAVSFLGSRT